MNNIDNIFDNETIELSPREQINGALIQDQLLETYKELKDFEIKNDYDLDIFRVRVNQFIVDHVNNINELNQDILDVFRQYPEYGKFIKTIEDKDSVKSDDFIMEQEKELMRKTKTQHINIVQKDLMKPIVKMMVLYGMISDINISSNQKIYDYIIEKREKEKIEKEKYIEKPIKDVDENISQSPPTKVNDILEVNL